MGRSSWESGDDVSNFFYNLKQAKNWWRRKCFVRVLSGAEAAALGGDLAVRYHLALCVCAVGDLNSVDIAQRTHESILESTGGFPLEGRLVYGQMLPKTNLVHGLHIDNLLVVLRLRQHDWNLRPAADLDRMRCCEGAYEVSRPRLPQKNLLGHKGPLRPGGLKFLGWRAAFLSVVKNVFSCLSLHSLAYVWKDLLLG